MGSTQEKFSRQAERGNPDAAVANPARIFVIRHAEDAPALSGVQRSLSWFGQARARALVAFFANPAGLASGKLGVLIAAEEGRHCRRPTETLEPLERFYALSAQRVSVRHPQRAAELAVAHARLERRNVLICWRNDNLPRLLRCLGVPSELVPARWPDDLFDRLYVLNIEPSHAYYRSMLLMHGDDRPSEAQSAGSAAAA